jgi:hypothetical protein
LGNEWINLNLKIISSFSHSRGQIQKNDKNELSDINLRFEYWIREKANLSYWKWIK